MIKIGASQKKNHSPEEVILYVIDTVNYSIPVVLKLEN